MGVVNLTPDSFWAGSRPAGVEAVDSLLHAGPPTMLLDVTPLPLRLATVSGYTEEIIAKLM